MNILEDVTIILPNTNVAQHKCTKRQITNNGVKNCASLLGGINSIMGGSNEPDEVINSPSYFWSCLTMKDDCPFFNTQDPKLYYFGICVLAMYGVFVLMIIGDLTFFWTTDRFNDQIDYYINLVRKKVRRVQMDQRRLVSMRDRSEKQLKRSRVCNDFVNSIRGALKSGDHRPIRLSSHFEDMSNNLELHLEQSPWGTLDNAIDL